MATLSYPANQHVSLCEALDRVLDTGAVATGEVTISLAEIDLIYLGLQLVVTSVKNVKPPSDSQEAVGDLGNLPTSGWRRSQPLQDRSATMARLPPVPSPRRPSAALSRAREDLPAEGKTLSSSPARELPPDPSQPRPTGGLRADRSRRHPGAKNGLGKLVLTLIKLLHELLERQALRRMESGSLSLCQIDQLGTALMQQAREIDRLRRDFGLEADELNLDLGPLGRLL